MTALNPLPADTCPINGQWTNDDVRTLRGASSLALAEVGPLPFEAAWAPQIAAAPQEQTIDRTFLLRSAQALVARVDVLVVGLRLGCINHALLTAQAVRACGLPLAGWVGNVIAPDMPWLDENAATLRQRLQGQGSVEPYPPYPTPVAVAVHLEGAALHTIFTATSFFLVST